MFKFSSLFILTCSFIFSITQVQANTDPTRPFGHKATSIIAPGEKKLVLQSIIHGDGIHTAVINGKVLRTLDRIGEYQLTAINDQSVVLRSKSKQLKLHIFKNNLVKVKTY